MQQTLPAATPPQSSADWLAQLSEFEQTKNYNAGLLSMLKLLDRLRYDRHFDRKAPVSQIQKEAQQYLRFYTIFVARADVDLLQQQYQLMARGKQSLGPLMDAALMTEMGPADLWGKFCSQEDGTDMPLLRALALVSLSNIHKFPGEKIKKIDPQLIAPIAYSCLAQRYAITKRQTANKKALMKIADFYEVMDFPGYKESNISLAWMYCSYLYWEKKHDLKTSINRVYLRWMEERRLVDKKTRKKVAKDKPTIVIFAEVFSDHHAMFRCHGKSAVALKNKFRTILITDLKNVTAETRAMFTKVVPLDFGPKCIEKNLKVIRKLYPDIIYYPSVGMSRNTSYLCNLRLAPVQFLSMGHPASTFSKEMDYVIVNNDLRPGPEKFSEKIIHRRQSAGYNMYPGWSPKKLQKLNLPATTKKRVGILGFLPKTTSEFIQVCRALEENVPGGVEFHFFPNSITIDFYGFSAALRSVLESTRFHMRAAYENYMKGVYSMDLVLSTFPFGNTNGTIDTLLARRPMVSLEGPEPHAKTDARLLRKVGAPEEMNTQSPQEYYQKALEWLSDDKKLADVTAKVMELDVEGTFFSDDEESDFDEMVSLIYEHHEKLQADSKREFEYEDLLALSEAKQAS